MATTQPSTASVVSQFGNRSAMMNNTAHMQHPTRAAVVGVVATQFGTRNNSSNYDRSSLPDCVHNTLPLSMLIPLDACHPTLCETFSSTLIPGTAFQMLMGSPLIKVVCGVYLSPTEWYIDGLTRVSVISNDCIDLDLKRYPGSSIPATAKTEGGGALWATMVISRIEHEKVFALMARKIDSRIIQDIRCRLSPLPAPMIPQFYDRGTAKYSCNICRKAFTSTRAYERHACVATPETKFECGICDGRFYTTQGRLDNHITSFHGGRTTAKIETSDESLAEEQQQVSTPTAGVLTNTMQHPMANASGKPLSPFIYKDFTIMTSSNQDVLTASVVTTVVADLLPSNGVVATTRTRVAMVYDEEESSGEEYLAPAVEGLSGNELLAIASTWAIGQEFVMYFKERLAGGQEYESHGMLLGWDLKDVDSPGPVVCYPEEETEEEEESSHEKKKKKKKNKKRTSTHEYYDEHLDCTSDYVVLRLVKLDATTVFDHKRKKLNRKAS